MKKIALGFVSVLALGAALAWSQSVGWPPPAGMMATLGVYNSAAPTLTTTQISPIQLDSAGNLKVVPGSSSTVQTTQIDGAQISQVACAALCANQIVKASSGQLYSFEVSATSTLYAAAWWIMVYNATSAPVDGAVTPAKCYALQAGTSNFAAAFPNPIPFSTGITIGVSTNGCFTKAASTQAFISADFK